MTWRRAVALLTGLILVGVGLYGTWLFKPQPRQISDLNPGILLMLPAGGFGLMMTAAMPAAVLEERWLRGRRDGALRASAASGPGVTAS